MKKKKPLTSFVNAKIHLTGDLTYDKALEVIKGLGYKWPTSKGPPEEAIPRISCLHLCVYGQIHHSPMTPECYDWLTHPGRPSTIINGKIVPCKIKSPDPSTP